MQQFLNVLVIVFILVAGLATSSCTRPEYSEHIDTVASPVRAVAQKLDIRTPYYRDKVTYKTLTFYAENGNKKAWLDRKHANGMFKAFVNEVLESYRYGMNPEDYDIKGLQADVEKLYSNRKRTETEMSRLDIRITGSFFLFTTHLLEGRIRYPGAPEFIWKKGAPKEDDVSLLVGLESASDLRKEIDRLHPKDPQYDLLRKELKEYKDMSSRDSSGSVSISRKLKPGDRDAAIPLIRKKLQFTDLGSGGMPDDTLVYDDRLVTAVKRFQKRHGMSADGIVDKETVKWLNVPARKRAELIALNLERIRWRPHLNPGNEYILVNIPEYMLRLYKKEKVALEMKVILGSDFNATPIFHDTLKYIVFSPTWNVPASILEEEFLPNLQHNPAYYSADFKFYKDGEEIDPAEEDWTDEDLELKKYRVVQDPGSQNALGHVKFVMPNNFNIYLHDTPSDGLFRREDRALSHGCIRLEKPVELADYLLADKGDWDNRNIHQAMRAQEPRTVRLKTAMPVNIVYRTVWVDQAGELNFREDIYGHDARQIAQLKRSGDFSGVISSE